MANGTSKVVKYGSTSVGLGVGNGVAYFILWYLMTYKGVAFDDPMLAMGAAGAVVSAVLLELRKIGSGIKYVFDRMFPAQKDS